MAFRFLQIGKANNEIARLESEIEQLKAQNAELTTNEPEALKGAEVALLEANTKICAAESTISELKTSLLKHGEELKANQAEIGKLTEALALKSAEVETKASTKAVEILASVGAPLPPAAPKTGTPSAKSLSGWDRIVAATGDQIAKVTTLTQ
jgi:hypothetical protein